MKHLLLTLFFICFSQVVVAAQTCTSSQVGPSSSDFDGISGSSDSNVIAVGENGMLYIYNGTSWSSKNSGTSQDLNAVSTLSTSLAYAVGDNGTIKIFDGTNWANSSSGTSKKLQGVWAYSATEVFAVGEEGVVLRYNGSAWSDLSAAANTGSIDLEAAWGNTTNFYALGKNGNLYVYNRSGDSWSTVTTCVSAIGNQTNALWGDSSGNIYIAIDGGAVYKYDGSTCTKVATSSENLNGIFGSNTTGEIYAVGDNGVVVYYNGTSWVSASEGSEDINAVWVSSTGNAYYAADQGSTSACTLSAGGGGSGAACTTITTSSGEDLDGISGSSKSDILGVGKNGDVWSYDGTSWTAVSVTGNPNKDLEDVFAIDSTNSVAVGDSGTVLLESTGSWSTLTAPTSKDLRGVWGYSTSEFYVFGKEGSVYSYNGTSWSNLASAAGTNSDDKFEDAWGNSTYVYGLTEDGNLFRYTRSGGAWTEITTCAVGSNIQFDDLWGDGSGNIYLAGKNDTTNKGVVYKYDGSSCSLVGSASDDLKGIFGSSSTGEIYAVGKNGYTLYYNGTTWTEGRRSTQDLNDVWVAPDGTPFYSGDGGTLTTCSVSSSFDHFLITHDGAALTCEPESITVTACANAACTAPHYTSAVSVTLNPTGWVGGDTQTISAGTSTFQLSKTTAATYTLGVSSSSPSAAKSVQCVNTAAGNSSCDITYYDTGFIYDVPNLTSCATSADVTISAVRLGNTTQACIPTFKNTNKTINFWSTYSSPSSGSKSVVISKGNTTIATSSPGTGINLHFNANGQTTIKLTYDDAGQLSLNSSYTSGALTMTGSDTFVSVPSKLNVYSNDANAACNSNNANCTVMASAGSNFNLKIDAACANNTVTPNFVLDNISITHTNTAPAIAQGNLGVASFDMKASDSGQHTINNQTVSEVGVFTFTAMTPSYFGLTGPSGTSTYIGRFTPDHFCALNSNLLSRTDSNTKASCTDSFNYLSEDFTNTFTLTAQNAAATCGDGSSTSNYTSTFSKFNTTNLLASDDTTDATETGILNFAALDSTSSTNLSSRINFNTAASISSGQFTNGSLAITAKMDIARSGSAPNYTAETAFTSSDLGIKPIDTDGITLSTTNLTINSATYFNVGNTALYFGRLYADSTFGSEQEGLPMWAEPQYCNAQNSGVCSDWKTKEDDTCSLYTVNAPTDTVIGVTNAGVNGYWVAGTDYSASSGITYSTDSNNHKAGWRVWYTDLPGGTGGTYTIPFVTHPYLITQDGSASFGLYRGDDRIIYWREVFN